MNKLILGAVLVGFPLLAVQAADRGEGAAYWQSVTVVNLNGEARRTVTADKMTANLAIEKQAKDAASAQAFVNEKMQLAKVAAGDVAGIKFETGGYNTYQMQQPMPVESGEKGRKTEAVWNARQEVNLSGGKPEDLTKLVASLQKMGFAVNGLGYTLSTEKNEQIRDELVGEALDDVKQKAQKLAAHLGLKNIRYAVINTNDSPVHYPMMRTMAMKAEMADAAMPNPVATPGSTDVVVTVNAEVHLR